MQLAGPRPHADFADRGRIDRDEHDVAAGLARERAKPQVGQQVLQNAAQPGQEREHEHACNKDMRSISLHACPPRPFLVCCSTIAGSGGRRLTATWPPCYCPGACSSFRLCRRLVTAMAMATTVPVTRGKASDSISASRLTLRVRSPSAVKPGPHPYRWAASRSGRATASISPRSGVRAWRWIATAGAVGEGIGERPWPGSAWEGCCRKGGCETPWPGATGEGDWEKPAPNAGDGEDGRGVPC